jgi:hypothetical protein
MSNHRSPPEEEGHKIRATRTFTDHVVAYMVEKSASEHGRDGRSVEKRWIADNGVKGPDLSEEHFRKRKRPMETLPLPRHGHVIWQVGS